MMYKRVLVSSVQYAQNGYHYPYFMVYKKINTNSSY